MRQKISYRMFQQAKIRKCVHSVLNLIAPGQYEKFKQLIMLGPKTTPKDKEFANTTICI